MKCCFWEFRRSQSSWASCWPPRIGPQSAREGSKRWWCCWSVPGTYDHSYGGCLQFYSSRTRCGSCSGCESRIRKAVVNPWCPYPFLLCPDRGAFLWPLSSFSLWWSACPLCQTGWESIRLWGLCWYPPQRILQIFDCPKTWRLTPHYLWTHTPATIT